MRGTIRNTSFAEDHMNVPPPPDDTDWKLNGEPPSPTFLLLSVLSAVAVFLVLILLFRFH